MQRLFCFWLGLLAAVATGCQHPAPVCVVSAAQRDAIQSRVANHFAHAVLFKPAEGGFESALVFQLAPLLIQATASTNAADWWPDRPGPTRSLPLLSVATNVVTLHTNHYPQFSYVWNYPQTGAAAGAATSAQGVRITLDSSGAPVIWEVLTDSAGADVIYVAQSLEALARAEFGPPLPGRKFAVERSPSEAATTIVANVISDGPVPMGPMLYLQAGSRDVSTLICRCMAAQFDVLLAQQDYQLQPATTAPAGFPNAPLAQRLRLPAKF